VKSLLVVVLLLSVVHPVNSQQKTSVQINGTEIPARLVDGQLLVRPEDVARATGGTISYDGNRVQLRVGATGSALPEDRLGSVKGNLSFYFNDNYGNKPDAGAKVYLVEGLLDPSSLDEYSANGDSFSVGAGIARRTYKLFATSQADGNGSFLFDRVPHGVYTVVEISSHAKGSSSRDILGKIFTELVNVTDDRAIDASHDFGVSAY
jgi:hypothetical protein